MLFMTGSHEPRCSRGYAQHRPRGKHDQPWRNRCRSGLVSGEKTKVQKAGHETAFERPRRFYHPRRHTAGWPQGMTTQGQPTRQNAPGSAGTSKPGVSGLPESKSGPTVT
jgi:hypothetical protein